MRSCFVCVEAAELVLHGHYLGWDGRVPPRAKSQPANFRPPTVDPGVSALGKHGAQHAGGEGKHRGADDV